MTIIKEEIKQKLMAQAIEMTQHSYAPYSQFHVGAALLGEDGNIYTGCNVENASYPAGICAERAAVAQAVSHGVTSFLAIGIAGGRMGKIKGGCAPCGICRQVLREFCEGDFLILTGESKENYQEFTLQELLPFSFGPENL